MFKARNTLLFCTVILLLLILNNVRSQNIDKDNESKNISNQVDVNKIAGFRASRILSSYPNRIFPEAEYWEQVGTQMADKFFGYQPGGVWIVSIYLSDPLGYTLLNFPKPNNNNYDSIIFSTTDQNESFLNHFDSTGVKVWLQVESGGANIDTLINLVLNYYKHHQCVQGFGVDVEWYETFKYSGGKKVNDIEVKRWESNVKSIDENYTLFLKHYSANWMPPNYRGEIIFIDDSQDFNWYSNPFNGMISEFTEWGKTFSPNPVGFQIGYPADQKWWDLFTDPAKTIGDKLIANIPNLGGIYWVDFTVISTFPPTSINFENQIPVDYHLSQNYPNPFNPSTKINFTIPTNTVNSFQKVNLTVYDILGMKIKTVVDEPLSAGEYEVNFEITENKPVSSGVMFYKLVIGNFTMSKKMIYLK